MDRIRRVKAIKLALKSIGVETREIKGYTEIIFNLIKCDKSIKYISTKLYINGLIEDKNNASINDQGHLIIY